MAPPPRPRSPPALMEELIKEILLRIPLDEPAHLVHVALVCKAWRRIILSDPGFLRRYRAFHRRRRPPLLGFFCNDWEQQGRVGYLPCFKPAAAAFPSVALPKRHRRRELCVLDCRHGRVLLRDRFCKNLMVWDPISDAWQELQVQDHMDCLSYCAAVLCGVAGYDHHDCRSGPFLVVYIGADQPMYGTIIFTALVYSSEAHAWGAVVSSEFDGLWNDLDIHYGSVTLIGDKHYCIFTPGANIIKYDLVKHCISVFSSRLLAVHM